MSKENKQEIEKAQSKIRGKKKEKKEEKKKVEEAPPEEEISDEERQSLEESLKKKEDLDLESIAKEKIDLPPEIMNSEYAEELSQKPMSDIYKEMNNIYKGVEKKGYINSEEERQVEYLSSAVEKKLEDVDAGSYTFSGDAAVAANITQLIGSKLMSSYKAGQPGSMYKH
jgi:hypothetical protein